MRVKPLTGQVLIELDPREATSPGGIAIPNRTLSPEEVQERHAKPTPPPGVIGKVCEIGAWPVKNGRAFPPPFGMGSKVIIPRYCGQELSWETSCRLRIVNQQDILAVLG